MVRANYSIMSIYEYLRKNFLDSCSRSMHDLEQRREIINEYKKQIKDFQDLLKNEDKSLKQLEDKI